MCVSLREWEGEGRVSGKQFVCARGVGGIEREWGERERVNEREKGNVHSSNIKATHQ